MNKKLKFNKHNLIFHAITNSAHHDFKNLTYPHTTPLDKIILIITSALNIYVLPKNTTIETFQILANTKYLKTNQKYLNQVKIICPLNLLKNTASLNIIAQGISSSNQINHANEKITFKIIINYNNSRQQFKTSDVEKFSQLVAKANQLLLD